MTLPSAVCQSTSNHFADRASAPSRSVSHHGRVEFGAFDRHVVGNVVDDHAERANERRIEKHLETADTTEFSAHGRVIRDVVAVLAAGDRLRDR